MVIAVIIIVRPGEVKIAEIAHQTAEEGEPRVQVFVSRISLAVILAGQYLELIRVVINHVRQRALAIRTNTVQAALVIAMLGSCALHLAARHAEVVVLAVISK